MVRTMITAGSLALATSTVAMAADKADLAAQHAEGSEAKYVMNVDQETMFTSPAMPQAQGQSLDQRVEMTWKVVESGEEGAKVELRYDRLVISLEGQMGEMSLDTADDENTNAGQLAPLQGLKGLTLTLNIAPDGTLESVEGFDGANVDPATAPMGGGLLTEQGVRQIVEPMLYGWDKPREVEVGETWEKEEAGPDGPFGTMTSKSTGKLVEVKDGKAKVDLGGTMVLAPNDNAQGEFDLSVNTFGGTLVWDVAKGMLERMHMDQDLVINGAMQGMDVEVASTTKRTIERIG